MRKTLLVFLSLGLIMSVFAGQSMATLYNIPLSIGVSFQNEGTTRYDDTANLKVQDGSFGPTMAGTVDFNYYATGTSPRFFDAVSLSFDTSSVQYPQNVHGLTLRFFLQTGGYGNDSPATGLGWHHYQVLLGAFNPENEDARAGMAPGNISFDYDAFQTGDWIEADLDLAWFASPELNLTLRLWNARLDAVELAVANSPVPEPATLLLLGIGLAGLSGFSRRKMKK